MTKVNGFLSQSLGKDNNTTKQDIINRQINKLKQQLSDTDYKSIYFIRYSTSKTRHFSRVIQKL